MAAPVGIAKMEDSPHFELDLDPFLIKMRRRIKEYIEKHHYESALFWADKLHSLSDSVEDVLRYAQTMYYTGQYRRAIHLLNNRKLIKSYSACRYLAALCHYECKELQEALNVLDMFDTSSSTLNTSSSVDGGGAHNTSACGTNDSGGGGDSISQLNNCENSICLLQGKIYEGMENRGLAADRYRYALRLDVYCFEAFDLLVSHNMLTASEEKELLDSLPFDSQCPPGEAELLRGLYQTRMKKYDCPRKAEISEVLKPLSQNLDVVVSQAEQHLYNCNFRSAHNITSKVLMQDPYNTQCLPIHIAVLVELKKSSDLFSLAHKLVEAYPDKCISWFAVGCYYMLTENYHFARWYLSKATTLERANGPTWLAYGHTFGMNKDHDQAMAAYFSASQIMRGCHLPLLYVGLEYGLTNNPKLAERFFSQARTIAPNDPFVLHEIGVIHFGNANFIEAERLFKLALSQVQACASGMLESRWEPLINNLGHVARKQGQYQDALDYHTQALVLCPQSASTYSSIGFVHSLMGNHSEAVTYFSKALGLKKDDAFSTTMLTNSMEAMMDDVAVFEGVEDDPKFPVPSPAKQQTQQQVPIKLAELLGDSLTEAEESLLGGQTKDLEEDELEEETSKYDDTSAVARGLVTPTAVARGLVTPTAVRMIPTGGLPATLRTSPDHNDSSLSIDEVDMDDCF